MARILIMEDDALQAEVWRTALSGRGHEVAWVAGAEAALATLVAHPFDVLVTDLYVPTPSGATPEGGLYLIGRMRSPANGGRGSRSDIARMPIVAVTGASVEGARSFDPVASARALGATVGLRKPLAVARLVAAVEQLV